MYADPNIDATTGLVMVVIMTVVTAMMVVRMSRHHDHGATTDIIGRRDSGNR